MVAKEGGTVCSVTREHRPAVLIVRSLRKCDRKHSNVSQIVLGFGLPRPRKHRKYQHVSTTIPSVAGLFAFRWSIRFLLICSLSPLGPAPLPARRPSSSSFCRTSRAWNGERGLCVFVRVDYAMLGSVPPPTHSLTTRVRLTCALSFENKTPLGMSTRNPPSL